MSAVLALLATAVLTVSLIRWVNGYERQRYAEIRRRVFTPDELAELERRGRR